MAKVKVSFRLSPESILILKEKKDMTQFVDTAIQYANANNNLENKIPQEPQISYKVIEN